MGRECHRYVRVLVMAACGFLAAYGPKASACQICLPIPKVSVVDRLLEAEVVVLAREDPQNPFSLTALETLKGDPGEVTIDLFLDSSSRRGLAFNPRRKIVCAYRSKGEDTGWSRIGTADGGFEALVRDVLERAPGWEGAPEKRVDYFGPFLGHKDPQISALAHLEVARAPYDQIKRFAGVIPVEQLRSFLKNIRLMEWHALYILLLAQSSESQDRDLIEERVRSAERKGSTVQLAAWTTAWIEIDEGPALDFVEEHYLGDPQRKEDEIKAVLAACSVQGTRGHTHLRGRIVEAYRSALGNHPAQVLAIVRDAVGWNRFELSAAVEAIVASPPPSLDRAAALELRSYLARAEEERQMSADSSAGEGKGTLMALLGVLLLVFIPVALRLAYWMRNRRVAGAVTGTSGPPAA